jgi:carotenoid cleavage dioxygenase-like enzyme
MPLRRQPPVLTTLRESSHPYMTGAWTPLHEETDLPDPEVIEGRIPEDIEGIYLRNTENPVHQPLGRYHPFDGDGMIHRMIFREGRASYANRFVRTRGFQAEQEAGGALWGGLADPVQLAKRPGFGAHGALKDSSSTDIVVHAGAALSTFYQCGEGYRLDPVTLQTLGVEGWTPIDGISAHPKVDERTGELMFFNYSKHAPYMHYGLVGPDNRLKVLQPIDLPGLHRAVRDPERPAGLLGRRPPGTQHPRRAPARGPAQPLRHPAEGRRDAPLVRGGAHLRPALAERL